MYTWEQITGKTWEDTTNLDPENRLLIAEEHREQMAEEARASLALHMCHKLETHGAAVSPSGNIPGATDDLAGEIREHASTWDYSPILSVYQGLSDYNIKMNN